MTTPSAESPSVGSNRPEWRIFDQLFHEAEEVLRDRLKDAVTITEEIVCDAAILMFLMEREAAHAGIYFEFMEIIDPLPGRSTEDKLFFFVSNKLPQKHELAYNAARRQIISVLAFLRYKFDKKAQPSRSEVRAMIDTHEGVGPICLIWNKLKSEEGRRKREGKPPARINMPTDIQGNERDELNRYRAKDMGISVEELLEIQRQQAEAKKAQELSERTLQLFERLAVKGKRLPIERSTKGVRLDRFYFFTDDGSPVEIDEDAQRAMMRSLGFGV